MPERWTLHRAGIVNVYQYGDEVLHFAGGRLLLRGLNGSGKSTAMNMLLPFLLEGDPRRIDAAGEQSGVLRSWMLEGREDAQPIGYLWLEMIRGDDTVSFGCGIKANRATDNVTTWWWITSRRPKIDLDLVEGRHPLSAEALRIALDPDPVYRQEERPRYRQELRRRLYGGSDLDQHLRLLHIVRNPRVGDRIDIELPGHLHEALPQLSEEALAEAAQPLDDLDEHRHNVNELRRTSATLDAMGEVYSQYARGQVHGIAGHLEEVAVGAEQAGRRAARAHRQWQQAVVRLQELAREAAELEGDQRRMETELTSLRDAPAYQRGRQLEDLRHHVRQLERDVDRAQDVERRAADALSERAGDVSRAAREAGDDQRVLAGRIRDLQALIVPTGLAAGAPDLPSAPQPDGEDLGAVPPLPAEVAPIQTQLEHVRAAVHHRRGDIEEVRARLADVDRAERALAAADLALARAGAERQTRGDQHLELRRALAAAAEGWRQALDRWVVTVGEVGAAPGLVPPDWPDLDDALIDRRHDVEVALRTEADRVTDHHAGVVASLVNRRAEVEADVAGRRSVVEELAEREVPPPPAQAWQRRDRRRALAELVDFRDGVPADDRAGLEAALEASGLLGAEVGDDGALHVGELIVDGEGQAQRPLAELLTAVPSPGGPDPSRTEALLGAISVDPAHLGEGSAVVVAVVTTDGRFRLGPISGWHAKPVAEHVGLTARRDALERAREAARADLAAARAELARVEQSLGSADAQLRSVRSARDALPSTARLEAVVAAEHQAAVDLRAADDHLEEQVLSHRNQEEAHAEAMDRHRRTAANHGLPLAADALAEVATGLGQVRELSGSIEGALTIWSRSIQGWQAAASRWRDAVDEETRARAEVDRSRHAHAPLAARLATLEDSIGVEYAEIRQAISHLEREMATVEAGRTRTADERLTATGAEASLRKEAEQEERGRDRELARCAEALQSARARLVTPGLLAAATPSGPAVLAPVEATPSGLRALVSAVEAQVLRPTQADVSADRVRASLRQRRDALGAGYDAEDRQADDQLLSVEINGPTGRFPLVEAISVVGARLDELSALLSAEQDGALRELLEGLIATEVAEKLHGAGDLVDRMNRRLDAITTSHGIGVSLRWRRRDDLDVGLGAMIELLGILPQLRSAAQDEQLRALLSERLADARRAHPGLPYRALIGEILDYRNWYQTTLLLRRPGHPPERLTKRTKLSEGEKKIVSYLPLFAAVAASCDAIGEHASDAPRFLLLDDAFAKVSEDNHAKLFGLLVDLDLDFIATSERLWGTHATVPELAITEVIRDASLGAIVLEHSRWDGRAVTST